MRRQQNKKGTTGVPSTCIHSLTPPPHSLQHPIGGECLADGAPSGVALCHIAKVAGGAQSKHPKDLLGFRLGGSPHPVIVTTKDNKDYIRLRLYSYYTTITGWGVLLRFRVCCN